MKENMKLKGSMVAVLKKANGDVQTVRKDNLILNAGFDFICNAIGNTSSRPAAMNHIAVGSGTTAVSASQTSLVSELDRKTATYSHTNGTKLMTFTAKFEAGEGTGAITEAGVVNASSGGTFIDRVTFAVINKGIDDELTMTFQFTLA